MKAVVEWDGEAAFTATTESGHRIAMDGPPDHGGRNLGPRPTELVLAGMGGCTSFDVVHILRKGRADVRACSARIEAERALALPGGLLGINNRDLRTFVTTIDRTLELVECVPPGRFVITESGILGRDEVRRLKAAGLRGFLVGEAFMVAADPGARLAELFEERVDESSG